MYRKLLFLSIVIVGIFFAVAVFAQTCPHIYEGINCGANWYCNGCQTTCKSCPGGGDPTGATELNYVSCTCGCPSGQIVCSNACVTAPACSTPTREQNNSSCNGCGACKSGYAADPANPNPPSPCLKAAYIDYPNTGYFQTSGDLKSMSGDLYLASGKAIRIDGAGTTTLSFKNFTGASLDLTLFGGLMVGAPTGGSKGPGTINAEQLCVQGSCRTTWPEAVSAFVDEGNVGFGPTAVLGTNDNTPLAFEINNVGRMYIDTAGNVGIGTTSPGVPLEVNGNIVSNAVSNVIKSGSSSGDYSIAMYSSGAYGIIQVANYAHTGGVLPLLMNPSGGNVGIGTTAPTHNLVVNGASPREYILSTSGNPELDLGDGTNHWAIYRDTATDQLRFWRTNDRMAITSSGNVGLGTISPASKLSILGNLAVGAAYVGLVGPGDGAIIQGNVGIGTSSPAYKLDVAGQANANQLCIAGDCRGVWPGATPPGGSDTQVQFNDGGAFGGSWGLAYNKTSSALSVGGPLMVGGTIGVNGLGANPNVGIQSRGSASGGYFTSSVASGYALLGQGDYGVNAYGNSFGLYGSGGAYGVYGNGSSYGVYGSSNNTGVYGYGSVYGIYGTTSFAAADAGYFYNTLSGTYARLGYSTWAGYFGGNTYASGNETIAGTSTIGSNLRIGSNSSADDDYIYFDDGSQYLEWENTMGRFFLSSTLFAQGQITAAAGGMNANSGGSIWALDASNQKSVRLRHDGVSGILDTNAPSGNPGNLVLQATYAGTIVRVEDDLAITGGTIVGSVTNMGSGTLNASQLCISNDCRAAWPSSGGTPGGANTNVQFNNGGAFGGNAGLTYNSGTSALTVGGLLTTGSLTIDSLSGVLKASGGAVSGGATTDNLTEGAANLYFTNARVRTAITKTAPITYDAGSGNIGLSTPLAVSYGGTGISSVPSAGAVVYGNGTNYTFTAVGSAGQYLQSTGAGAPTWAAIPSGVSGSGSANYVTKFIGATTVGNSQIIDTGTSVGIGWSPMSSVKLDINGSTYIDGNLGLGTYSPSYKIHAVGDIYATGALRSGANEVRRCTGATNTGVLVISANADARCGAGAHAATGLYID